MDSEMRFEVACLLEVSQAFHKGTEKRLFSATSALSLIISLINAHTSPYKVVLKSLSR